MPSALFNLYIYNMTQMPIPQIKIKLISDTEDSTILATGKILYKIFWFTSSIQEVKTEVDVVIKNPGPKSSNVETIEPTQTLPFL